MQTFCHTLHYTGCRISEALNTISNRVMVHRHAIVFETLKKRGNVHYREVPVPEELIDRLDLETRLSTI